jgi:hypothetical protein
MTCTLRAQQVGKVDLNQRIYRSRRQLYSLFYSTPTMLAFLHRFFLPQVDVIWSTVIGSRSSQGTHKANSGVWSKPVMRGITLLDYSSVLRLPFLLQVMHSSSSIALECYRLQDCTEGLIIKPTSSPLYNLRWVPGIVRFGPIDSCRQNCRYAFDNV